MGRKSTKISKEDIIALVRHGFLIKDGMRIESKGSLRADGKALQYKGDATGTGLSYRLRALIKSGDLALEEVKARYKQFGREQIDDIPKERIVAFVRNGFVVIDGVRIESTGVLATDADALGYQADSPGAGFSERLRQLIKSGDLALEEVKARYKQFAQEHIEHIHYIPKEKIIAFIRGQLDIKPTGVLARDGKALKYKGDRPGKTLSDRLRELIAEDPSLLPLVERIYQHPCCNWRAKTEPSHEVLAQAIDEGLPEDEIKSTFNLSAGALKKWKKSRKVDDARTVPREEFLAAVRGTASLADAATKLGLTEPAVLRRAGRYMNMEVIKLEKTPSVRWEEAHMPAWLPADSPAAVLVCAKQLIARFNGHAKPTIIDVAASLKQPRNVVEQHIELLMAQGLLDREQLAQPEMV